MQISKSTIFALLLATRVELVAQNTSLGLQTAIFTSKLKTDNRYFDFQAQTGFSGGLFYRIPLHKGLSVQPEASFTRRPVRGTYTYETFNALHPIEVLNYAADQNIYELGVVLHNQFGQRRFRPYIAGGMSFGVITNKKVAYVREDGTQGSTAFDSNDVSALLEAGGALTLSGGLVLSVGIRYGLAFNYLKPTFLVSDKLGANHTRYQLNIGISKEL